MWLFTPIGFVSAVRKPGEQVLTVRARAPGDLENLRDTYMPTSCLPMKPVGPPAIFRQED